MNKKLPARNEIEEVTNLVKGNDFVWLASLADLVNRYVDMIFEKEISRLTHSALNILVARGGSLTPTELARLLYRSKHGITKVIDSLEKDGLVIRDRSDNDRRVTHVRVTFAGLELIKKNLHQVSTSGKGVMSCLNHSEAREFRTLSQKLRRELIGRISSRKTPFKVS